MQVLQTPNSFSNLQKELLKLYAVNVSEDDLIQIRMMIGNYFAEKATDSMESFFKRDRISASEYNNWENEHNRKSSN